MLKFLVKSNSTSTREILTLRLSILLGCVLIALFMIGDLQMVLETLVDAYFNNRVFIQLPILFILLAFSFHRRFSQFAQLPSC